MADVLFWLYLANATLLIVHEIDSAYRQEWKLFRLPGGISFFLVLHLPLVFLMLYGLVQVHQESLAGQIFSLVLSLAGIFAFSIHTFFTYRGHPEFKTPVSVLILIATLGVSVAQLVTTLLWLA
jgi:cation transport ATPase